MDHWCRTQGIPRGESLSLEATWALAKAWYHDRLEVAWRRKTVEEIRATFDGLGLTGPFWRLEG